jgi:hypothetical protein
MSGAELTFWQISTSSTSSKHDSSYNGHSKSRHMRRRSSSRRSHDAGAFNVQLKQGNRSLRTSDAMTLRASTPKTHTNVNGARPQFVTSTPGGHTLSLLGSFHYNVPAGDITPQDIQLLSTGRASKLLQEDGLILVDLSGVSSQDKNFQAQPWGGFRSTQNDTSTLVQDCQCKQAVGLASMGGGVSSAVGVASAQSSAVGAQTQSAASAASATSAQAAAAATTAAESSAATPAAVSNQAASQAAPTSSAGALASAAADNTASAAQSSQSSVSLPGQKLSVLPIGLGVFGGVTALALIVRLFCFSTFSYLHLLMKCALRLSAW